MPDDNWTMPELLSVLGAIIISIISGTISIGRRVLKGKEPSPLWLFIEYLTAIMSGYLAYHAFPGFEHLLPEWATRVMVVALAAHSGGRVIQEAERRVIERLRVKK